MKYFLVNYNTITYNEYDGNKYPSNGYSCVLYSVVGDRLDLIDAHKKMLAQGFDRVLIGGVVELTKEEFDYFNEYMNEYKSKRI